MTYKLVRPLQGVIRRASGRIGNCVSPINRHGWSLAGDVQSTAHYRTLAIPTLGKQLRDLGSSPAVWFGTGTVRVQYCVSAFSTGLHAFSTGLVSVQYWFVTKCRYWFTISGTVFVRRMWLPDWKHDYCNYYILIFTWCTWSGSKQLSLVHCRIGDFSSCCGFLEPYDEIGDQG